MGISYRLYTEEDYTDYVKLYKKVFNKEISSNYFKWKFENDKNPAIIFCAFNSEGKMVGSRVVLLTEIFENGHVIKGAQSIDSMVDSTYRGMGIYKNLNLMAVEELRKKNVNRILTFPNENSFPPLNKLGWKEVYSISIKIKILNYKHLFPAIPVLKKLLTLKDNMRRNYQISSNVNISEVQHFNVEIVNFIYETLKSRTHQRRSSDYLEWKYNEKPGSEYVKLLLKVENTLVGFFVIRKNKNNYRTIGTILECIITEGQNRKKMMRVLLTYLRSKNFDIVKIWSYEKAQLNSSLLSLGFITRKTPLKFALNQIDDQGEDGEWFISAGDADTA